VIPNLKSPKSQTRKTGIRPVSFGFLCVRYQST